MKSKTIKTKVYNLAGEEVSSYELNGDVFGIEPHQQVVFDSVLVEQANARQATAKTKVRHEVSGGGKKPWRQKGTGRARAGSSRSPIWVGGGTVFGPVGNQNFKLSQNKKEHKLALKSVLSLKAKEGLVVVDNLIFNNKKTKDFVNALKALKVEDKALVVTNEIDENICASVHNINWVKLVTWDNVSVYDVMNSKKLIMSVEAVKKIEEALK